MRKIEKMESPEARFKRIAELRTNAVLDKIRILGNLSNRQMYSYSQEDINKIFMAINKQIKEVRLKFDANKQEKFRL